MFDDYVFVIGVVILLLRVKCSMFWIIVWWPIIIVWFILKTDYIGFIFADIELIFVGSHLIIVDVDEFSVNIEFTSVDIEFTSIDIKLIMLI